MADVLLSDVSKRFGKETVVHPMNLDVRDKEFLVIVGPSGCGKTTTLRMIAGLEEASNGEIFIGGRNVTEIPPKGRDIAMVFRNYALYPHMNVYTNMAFGLQLRKFSKKEIETRVKEASKILGISELLFRKPRALSGGQRQRVAMGRAIVRKPQVFLFDEPLSNLDAKLRVQMRAELAKLHGKLETTVIYVTHDQVEAMTLADRIVVMENGFIMQIGKPLDVYEKPKNIFVAGFVGSPSMNLLDARVAMENQKLYVDAGSFRLLIPDKFQSIYAKCVDKEVKFGIRPEHINKGSYTSKSVGIEKFEGQVDVVEPIGSEIILIISNGEQSLTAKVDSQGKFSVHTKVEFNIDMNRMQLFDKNTGEAVL